MEKTKRKQILYVSCIAFIILLTQISNVKALGFSESISFTDNFSGEVYEVSNTGNYTYITFPFWIYPTKLALTTSYTFNLNISYDDLPDEIGFDYAPLSVGFYPSSYVARVGLGFYQSETTFYMYNTLSEEYQTLSSWYMAGSLFEDDTSLPFTEINLQATNFNFTKVTNNLYSQSIKVAATEIVNLIISGQPKILGFFRIVLFHDYTGSLFPVVEGVSIPLYQGSNPIRDVPTGEIWERFFDNASIITLLIVVPLLFAWKINKKLLPLLMIVMLIICIAGSYISILQLIVGVLCSVLMFLSSIKEEEQV